MAEIGQTAIWFSVFSISWSIFMLTVGLRNGNLNAILSGQNGIVATFILLSIAVMALCYGFITDDFSLKYVAEGSSSAQPLLYKLTALWGRMSGSLLFWLWILTLFSLLMLRLNAHGDDDYLANYSLLPMSIVSLFFAVLVTGLIEGVENPFAKFSPNAIPIDGLGMNPLLQTPSMAFHPPMLYFGFVGLTVPFAFAIGALMLGRTDSEWLIRGRRWTLFAWATLTLGIAFGGNWAYRELGWGGYWAWDPVENASLMPWLLSSAYLHSVMMQEKRNMLKLWNVVLVTLSFQFTLIGTFITRSGVISSVHAFAQSDIGAYFLGFIFLSSIGVAILVMLRWRELKSQNNLESLLSRESLFVLNNWIFVCLTLIVLWGTTWPIISEAISSQKSSVPEEFFNKTVIIPGLILLFLTGAGPIIPWKKLTIGSLRRVLAIPTIFGLSSAFVAMIYLSIDGEKSGVQKSVYTIFTVALSVFVLTAIFHEFYRGAKLRSKRNNVNLLKALLQLILRNKRRYGGYVIHIGIVIVYIGIMGSKGYFLLESKSIRIGDSVEIGDYKLTMGKGSEERHPNYLLSKIDFSLEKGGKKLGVIQPARAFFDRASQGSQDTIESAIRHFGLNDLYVALGPLPPSVEKYVRDGGIVSVQIFYNPLISLVWIGVLIMIFGVAISMVDGKIKPIAET